jgi:hypothetical protein
MDIGLSSGVYPYPKINPTQPFYLLEGCGFCYPAIHNSRLFLCHILAQSGAVHVPAELFACSEIIYEYDLENIVGVERMR